MHENVMLIHTVARQFPNASVDLTRNLNDRFKKNKKVFKYDSG